jgi:hypothetical protein
MWLRSNDLPMEPSDSGSSGTGVAMPPRGFDNQRVFQWLRSSNCRNYFPENEPLAGGCQRPPALPCGLHFVQAMSLRSIRGPSAAVAAEG